MSLPVTAGTSLYIVKVVVDKHPVGNVYVIVAVPRFWLVATPVVDTIVATVVLLLDQVPPAVALAKFIVLPRHILLAAYVMFAGSGFTVKTLVTKQPVGIT